MRKRIVYAMALAFFITGFCLNGGLSMTHAWAQTSQGENVMTYVKNASGTWYTGKIDHIDGKNITICDVNHCFAPDALFVSKEGLKVSRHHFHKGEKVKMLLNSKFKCQILLKI